MSNYKIDFFGWCHSPENNQDKVWGWVTIGQDNVLYNFWGKRGEQFTFKKYDDTWGSGSAKLQRLMGDKTRPGRKNGTYVEVDPNDVDAVIPDFHEKFMNQLVFAKLFDNFHGVKKDD